MADDTARDCARALARFEDPELAIVGAGLPDMIRLLPLLELDEVDADCIAATDGRRPARSAAGGTDRYGRGRCLLASTSTATGRTVWSAARPGSGKSELLRTMVAGLAASVDPDHLTFVLIDFKGGSAFDECARLPHTVGHGHRPRRAPGRAGAALPRGRAEVPGAGAARGGCGRPARLPARRAGDRNRSRASSSSIDEFATLKAELPEFVDALVGVAQRGRSLGVHMVLATQRPSGAVSDNIQANTNLRIALRVQDDVDSTDIIDRPRRGVDCPGRAAGRAYVRLGAGRGGGHPDRAGDRIACRWRRGAVDVAPFRFGPSPRATGPAMAPSPVDEDGGGQGDRPVAPRRVR